MNKIFKIIWNHTTQSSIVTSELAKGLVKSSSSKNIQKSTAANKMLQISAIMLGLLGTANVQASTVYGNNAQASANGATAIGENTQASERRTTAIGVNAIAQDIDTTAVGTDAQAIAQFSTAIGSNAKAIGNQTIALGVEAYAKEGAAIAIGKQTNATGQRTVALGDSSTATGLSSTALGVDSKATGNLSTATGPSARASGALASSFGPNAQASGNRSVAVGTMAQASDNNTIAMGTGATASKINAIAIGTSSKASSDQASAFGRNANAEGLSSTSLGANSSAKVDHSVALGSMSVAGANDFNKSATEITFKTKKGEDKNVSFSGTTATENGVTLGAISVGTEKASRQIQHVGAGRLTADSTDAINGSQLFAVITNLGFNVAEHTADNSKARINNNNVLTFANGTGTVASVTEEGVVKYDISPDVIKQIETANNTANTALNTTNYFHVNNGSNAASNTTAMTTNQDKVGLAGGAQGLNSITAGVNTTTTAMAVGAIAIGHNTSVGSANATVIGNNVIVGEGLNDSVVLGNDSSAEGSHAVETVTEATVGNITYGGFKGTVKDKGHFVSVGAKGNERKVTNVAAGNISEESTEAINGSQLYAVTKELDRVNEVVKNVPTKQYVDNSVNAVRNDLRKTDKKLRGGIAGATAVANIPQVTKPGGSMVGLGVGNYKGQSSVAVGYSRASDNNKVIFKVSGAANTQGDYNVGAGVGYQW